ncbi:hypothetical protein LQ564_10875 [Massilia sp. G4R7]|uniref:Uncharacterized protein n=1 Tax=Massilia phyllostachyos TaxID=2898585 RepID=A0ABS8Q4Y9_9BURK|nr:hypothetical protein [Massilia phyllostachyos]MCD2516812.1 hypothetical protein [Massilia phyllostachyos]
MQDTGSSTRSDQDDESYRKHFDSAYGASGASYDEVAPAYGYGSQVAGSGRHAGRHWDDVEPELRSDWDNQYGGGASAWDKIKAAVRHGWDRVTRGDSGLTY